MGGYSNTPLTRKLGFREGMKIAFLEAPARYLELVAELPEGCSVLHSTGRDLDMVHLFSLSISDLEKQLLSAKKCIKFTGMLWISWPRKTSGLHSDLDGNKVRRLGLSAGLVDVKVCAIDDTWSALKFVYRVKDR